jgi:outer membrane protein assembly factor BamB
MNLSQTVFVGIKGSVIALNKASGDLVWTADLKGGDFVNVIIDGDDVFATTRGEIFCLNPATGVIRWTNRLKGYGLGLATICGSGTTSAPPIVLMAEKRRQDEAAADAGTIGAV